MRSGPARVPTGVLEFALVSTVRMSSSEMLRAAAATGSTWMRTANFCEPNTSTYQKYAVVVKNALERAGFQITLNMLDKAAYYTTIGDKLGCDCKTVDNALQRVKRKVGAHLQSRAVLL